MIDLLIVTRTVCPVLISMAIGESPAIEKRKKYTDPPPINKGGVNRLERNRLLAAGIRVMDGADLPGIECSDPAWCDGSSAWEKALGTSSGNSALTMEPTTTAATNRPITAMTALPAQMALAESTGCVSVSDVSFPALPAPRIDRASSFVRPGRLDEDQADQRENPASAVISLPFFWWRWATGYVNSNRAYL